MKHNEQLKPCPFCGGKAYIEILMGNPYIKCYHKKKCKLGLDTWLISDKPLRKQIKIWNRRKDDAKTNGKCK